MSFCYILFPEKRLPNAAVTPQCQSQFTPKMKANAVLQKKARKYKICGRKSKGGESGREEEEMKDKEKGVEE